MEVGLRKIFINISIRSELWQVWEIVSGASENLYVFHILSTDFVLRHELSQQIVILKKIRRKVLKVKAYD